MQPNNYLKKKQTKNTKDFNNNNLNYLKIKIKKIKLKKKINYQLIS
jgi:hypothetical protein